MDFSRIELDDELAAFRDEQVGPFLDEHLPDAVLARERLEGNGFVPEYQRALADRGWLEQWLAPAADGGRALDPVRAAIVRAEETDRVGPLFPVTGSHSLVMSVVRQFGSDALRAEIADRVHRGEIQACLGYTEPDCGSDAAAIRTRAVRDGDEWMITGQKMFSTGAHLCQYVMLTARTNAEVPKHQGITMFLVPLDHAGVEVQGIGTLGGERTNFVYLDGVRVADTYRLGPVDQGWAIASGALAAEHGMGESHGAPRTMGLPRTTSWVRWRPPADGWACSALPSAPPRRGRAARRGRTGPASSTIPRSASGWRGSRSTGRSRRSPRIRIAG